MPSIEKFREKIASLDEIGLKKNEKEIIIQRKLREFLAEAVSVPRDFVTSFLVDIEKIANVYTYDEYLSIQRSQELCQCKGIKLPEKVVYIEHNNKRMPLAYEEPISLFKQLKRKKLTHMNYLNICFGIILFSLITLHQQEHGMKFQMKI